MSAVAPEQTGFELDRFQWSEDDRLEVEGRWFGVRGRRFVRPVLTVQVAGRRRRLLALLEHKPWSADEGETWIAAFPWEGTHDAVGEGELEVGALTVDLPPPGGARRPRPRPEPAPPAAAAAEPEQPVAAEPAGDARLRAAGETRQQLERDLAGARAELGRLRARHDEELRDARAQARAAAERASELGPGRRRKARAPTSSPTRRRGCAPSSTVCARVRARRSPAWAPPRRRRGPRSSTSATGPAPRPARPTGCAPPRPTRPPRRSARPPSAAMPRARSPSCARRTTPARPITPSSVRPP